MWHDYFLAISYEQIGNRIALPLHALQELDSAGCAFPFVFQIDFGEDSYSCGVSDFSADEGTCLVPRYIFERLGLQEMDEIKVTHKILRHGQFALLEQQEKELPADVKIVLERELKNYPCITERDIIRVQDRGNSYGFLVKKCLPDSSVLSQDCDLEVDFELAPQLQEKDQDPNDFDPRKHRLPHGIRQKNKFIPFKGTGVSL